MPQILNLSEIEDLLHKFWNLLKWDGTLKNGIFQSLNRTLYLKSMVAPTPQKSALFSKLRQLQKNPRPDFESPKCPLLIAFSFAGRIPAIWILESKIQFLPPKNGSQQGAQNPIFEGPIPLQQISKFMQKVFNFAQIQNLRPPDDAWSRSIFGLGEKGA